MAYPIDCMIFQPAQFILTEPGELFLKEDLSLLHRLFCDGTEKPRMLFYLQKNRRPSNDGHEEIMYFSIQSMIPNIQADTSMNMG